MPSERENETRQIISDVMGSSVNWPANFKKVLPAWLEISQPAFHLSQLIGWQSHIGNNGSVPATSPLSLTTTPQAVTGMSTTLYSAGSYLITANMEVTLAVTTGNTGALFGASAANVDRGFESWDSPSDALADDGNTTESGTDTESDYLVISDFFTVPPLAIVTGIALAFEGNTTLAGYTWHSQLRKAGTFVGTADTSTTNATAAVEAHGGTTDLWGTTWTGEEINEATFGVGIWGTGGAAGTFWIIDYVKLTAYLANLHDIVVGYLYVDGVAQTSVLSVPVGGGATGSGTTTWFITTEADDIDIEFRAEKTYDGTAPTVTTNSELIIVRTA